MDSHLKFGEFIESKRKAAQMTMRAFADKAGVTAPYLSRISRKGVAQLQKASMKR